jgi:hypothetical protein
MEKNKWFWPVATVVICFGLGWFTSFAKYDLNHKKEVLAHQEEVIAHKKEVLATSEKMLCQLEQVQASEEKTDVLMLIERDLLKDKHDFGEDSFSMLGGDEQMANVERAILLSKIRTEGLRMIYNGMAQTADPDVFELGFPRHMGDLDSNSDDVI